MDDQKKGFFELLDPRSALIVGVIGGLLSLGTIGFFVLSAVAFNGKLSNDSYRGNSTANANLAAAPEQQAPVPQNIPKSDKPKVELFVMSYCPYGLQMEKALMPAWDLLKNKADISVKFVNYAMHGKVEVDENTREYCIQSEQPQKFASYLKCFFAGKGGSAPDYKTCLRSAGVDETRLNSCMTKVDKQYQITAKFDDESSWLSGRYPQYMVHNSENQKYGVQGSPTLIINGADAEVARTPDAIKNAICGAFNNAPAECGQALSNLSFQPGFGLSTASAGSAPAAGCET